MQRLLAILPLFFLLIVTPAQGAPPFPDLPLTGTLTPEQTAYLSPSGTAISPSSVKAEYLFVEVFSMYCPICQRDAPSVNALYKKVVASALGKRVRFLGIGVGNTPFEVDFYRKKFEVPFPLFEDPSYAYHEALGEVGTPAFYLVDVKGA